MKLAPDERGMLYANLLSLCRVPLAGLIWVDAADPLWVLPVMGLAGLSDVLDGWVARRARGKLRAAGDMRAFAAWGHRGEVIDAFADKVFVSSAVLALWIGVGYPLWLVALVASREILFVPVMIGYRLAAPSFREKIDFTAEIPGKAATIAQFLALVLGFLQHPLFDKSAYGACGLGVVAVVYYVFRAIRGRETSET